MNEKKSESKQKESKHSIVAKSKQPPFKNFWQTPVLDPLKLLNDSITISPNASLDLEIKEFLYRNIANSDDLWHAIQALAKTDLLEDNFSIFRECWTPQSCFALNILNAEQLLDQEVFNFIIQYFHRIPHLDRALFYFKQAEILNYSNFKKLINNVDKIVPIFFIAYRLGESNLLILQSTFDNWINTDSEQLSYVAPTLNMCWSLFSQNDFNTFLNYRHFSEIFTNAVSNLFDKNILTLPLLSLLMERNQQSPLFAAAILCLAKDPLLFTEDFISNFLQNPLALDIAESIIYLEKSEMLTFGTLNLLLSCGDEKIKLAKIIKYFQELEFLSYSDFNSLVNARIHKDFLNCVEILINLKILNGFLYDLLLKHPQNVLALTQSLIALYNNELLEPDNIHKIEQHIEEYWYVIFHMQQLGILHRGSFRGILNDPTRIIDLSRQMFYLERNGILSKDNFYRLIDNLSKAKASEIQELLKCINHFEALDQDSFALLMDNIDYFCEISDSIAAIANSKTLSKTDLQLLATAQPDAEIRALLMKDAEVVSAFLMQLEKHDLMNDVILEVILENFEHMELILNTFNTPDKAENFVRIIKVLNSSNLLKENFSIILENIEHLKELQYAVSIYSEARELDQNALNILIQHLSSAYSFASAWNLLFKFNLDSEKVLNILRQNAYYASQLAVAFVELSQAGIFTDDYCNLVIQHPSLAPTISMALCALETTQLLAPNKNLLQQFSEHLPIIADGVLLLMNAKLLNEANFFKLLMNAQQTNFTDMMQHLSRRNILTQNNFDTLTRFFDHPTMIIVIADMDRNPILTQEDFDDQIQSMIAESQNPTQSQHSSPSVSYSSAALLGNSMSTVLTQAPRIEAREETYAPLTTSKGQI